MRTLLKTRGWFALSLLLVCCTSCRTANSPATVSPDPSDADIVTLGIPEFEGALYFFQTTRGVLRQTPQWKPEAEFPPLSPRRAERAALQRAQQLRPDVKKWHRESICLRESAGDAWYYEVTFWRGDIAITGLPSLLRVPVLMDGQALPATADPKVESR